MHSNDMFSLHFLLVFCKKCSVPFVLFCSKYALSSLWYMHLEATALVVWRNTLRGCNYFDVDSTTSDVATKWNWQWQILVLSFHSRHDISTLKGVSTMSCFVLDNALLQLDSCNVLDVIILKTLHMGDYPEYCWMRLLANWSNYT